MWGLRTQYTRRQRCLHGDVGQMADGRLRRLRATLRVPTHHYALRRIRPLYIRRQRCSHSDGGPIAVIQMGRATHYGQGSLPLLLCLT